MCVKPRSVFEFDSEKTVVAFYEGSFRQCEDVASLIRKRSDGKVVGTVEQIFHAYRTGGGINKGFATQTPTAAEKEMMARQGVGHEADGDFLLPIQTEGLFDFGFYRGRNFTHNGGIISNSGKNGKQILYTPVFSARQIDSPGYVSTGRRRRDLRAGLFRVVAVAHRLAAPGRREAHRQPDQEGNLAEQ